MNSGKIFNNQIDELVEIIKNFINGELNIQINSLHVIKWIKQFDGENRNVILNETLYILT